MILRIFAVSLSSNLIAIKMNEVSDFTEQEKELILMIRRYKKSKHNPSRSLKWYIYELFENLLNDD